MFYKKLSCHRLTEGCSICKQDKGTEICIVPHRKKAKARAKAQVLGIAPLNMRSTCQRRFTIVEVVTEALMY